MQESFWKTYDYKSGKSFILGKMFKSKADALKYARECGFWVIGKSTRKISYKEVIECRLQTK